MILGNSARIPMLIDQMTVANERVGGRTILVLTEGDPSEMLHDVANVVGDSRGSRLVYRSGGPTRRADLQLVRLHAANTVIVLAGDEGDVRAVPFCQPNAPDASTSPVPERPPICSPPPTRRGRSPSAG